MLALADAIDAGAAPPAPRPLGDTARAAADFIVANPGTKGATVAKAIDVTHDHFRQKVVPVLKSHGFYNADGYRPPNVGTQTAHTRPTDAPRL